MLLETKPSIFRFVRHVFLIGEKKEKGAAGVLPLMVSTFSGTLFLFTFYNLTQYTAARSGAEQAARRAARCLSASDAECRDTVGNGLTDESQTQNWYGYLPTNGPTTIQVDKYTYNAQVFSSKFSASFNSYDVQTANPIVVHQEVRVKPTRFLGLLNSYQRLRADIEINVKNRVTNAEKSCFLKEAIELPAILDFNQPAIYFDPRWCAGHTSLANLALTANNCADVNDGNWELNTGSSVNFSHCRLTLPAARSAGEVPWTQLGGDPVCDGDPEAPFAEIPQTEEDLNRGFESAYGSRTEPGSTGRAYPVTGTRQFVVVEVFSCDPEGFLTKLKNEIKDKDDLKKYFATESKIDVAGFKGKPDFDGSGGESSFVFSGGKNSSFIAEQFWTYFEWSRNADGLRHLERKVCNWVTFDQARSIYPEFSSGNTDSYVSGSSYGNDIPTLTFYDAPSCLKPEKQDVQFNCGNTTIFGQPGTLADCSGWSETESSLRSLYNLNLKKALAVNSDESWSSFENLPLGFSSDIKARYSANNSNSRWNFSWSDSEYQGVSIVNPAAIRAHNGVNPKFLPAQFEVDVYQRVDNQVDPNLEPRLKAAISQFQGHAGGPVSFKVIPKNNYRPIEISAIWPFIKDENGSAYPVTRPYINPEFNGSGFDYDLNCKPDNACEGSNHFETLEQLLRTHASGAIQGVDLRDPAYLFTFQETLVGHEFVTPDSTLSFPACTQYKTLCQDGVGGGSPIFIGVGSVMPDSCRNGQFLNCYPEYSNSHVATQNYKSTFLEDIAKLKALSEVRRLIPNAELCEDMSVPNCVNVGIEQVGKVIQVGVNFTAPLTTPFKEILGQDTLIVTARKEEIIETDRLSTSP